MLHMPLAPSNHCHIGSAKRSADAAIALWHKKLNLNLAMQHIAAGAHSPHGLFFHSPRLAINNSALGLTTSASASNTIIAEQCKYSANYPKYLAD